MRSPLPTRSTRSARRPGRSDRPGASTRPARISRPALRTTGRVAATVAALAAVTTGVIVAEDVAGPIGAPGVGLAEAELVRHSAPGPDVADRTDVPGLQAARQAALARQRDEEEARQRADAAEQARLAEARAARAQAEAASRAAFRDPRGAARGMLGTHGWTGAQFSCLDALWTKESGWNPRARNGGSGAFGIPQALPGGKMASAGEDWATNPVTQIRWGLQYIADVYGSPCSAWAHSRATNWY